MNRAPIDANPLANSSLKLGRAGSLRCRSLADVTPVTSGVSLGIDRLLASKASAFRVGKFVSVSVGRRNAQLDTAARCEIACRTTL